MLRHTTFIGSLCNIFYALCIKFRNFAPVFATWYFSSENDRKKHSNRLEFISNNLIDCFYV